MKSFKQNFRRLWAQNPEEEITREIISNWIKQAWNEVPEQAISNSFRHFIEQSNEVNDSQDTAMEIEDEVY